MYFFFIFQYMRDRGGAKRPLPFSSNPQDGAVGQAGIHSHPAQTPHHEEATISARQAHVRIRIFYTKGLLLITSHC